MERARTRSRDTTRHMVLFVIGLLWLGMVWMNLEYAGQFFFHYVFVSIKWIQYLFIALSLYSGLLLSLGVVMRRRPAGVEDMTPRPFVSVLVPAKDEEQVIEPTLRSLAALEYHADGVPQFELIVIDDGSTDRTSEILDGLSEELNLRVLRTPTGSVGKAAALNLARRIARGELLAVFDADSRVAPDFLRRLVAYFDDPRVGGVQGNRRPYNAGHNVLTRMQEDWYVIFQTYSWRARDRIRSFVSFSGNGLIVRCEALDDVNGWDEEALTEDIDLSLRFHLRGWGIRYDETVIIWEEAVPRLWGFIRQRTRWFEGSIRCLGEYLPALILSRVPLRTKVDAVFSLASALAATLAILTIYMYAVMRLVGVVVLYRQIPTWVVAGSSLFFTAGLLGAVVHRSGWDLRAMGAFLGRFGLFSLHGLVVVPLGIYRYVQSAMTGRHDWAKTDHVGDAAPEFE